MSTLLSGVHGRQRRQERNIEKIDLKRARRYGMMEIQVLPPEKSVRKRKTAGDCMIVMGTYQSGQIQKKMAVESQKVDLG